MATIVYISCVVMTIHVMKKESDLGAVEEAPYMDLSHDPQVQVNVMNEFNEVWNHLSRNLKSPMERLNDVKRDNSPSLGTKMVHPNAT